MPPPDPRPVTGSYAVRSSNPGHTVIGVFVGRTHGARGHCGELTFRTDELDELTSNGAITLHLQAQPNPGGST